ncbi:MAG: molybdate ABC transporter permease subunit [Pseudomonadota bacterium]|nr:molybdate ABC transporter permease subunit [Pseudomonadota bacterium]
MLSPEELNVLLLSLKVSFWATACSLPIGMGAAWILARYDFPGKILVDGLVHLPLVLPPVVVGYLLLVTLNPNGSIGRMLSQVGIEIGFTWIGASVAAAIMAFPLMVRAMRLAFEMIDQRLELAARTLGASPLRMLFYISFPLAMPGIVTGTILAFARCLGEFGATITFVSNIPGETRTLPLAVYTLTQTPEGEAAAFRLVIISVFIALIALGISEVITRQAKARLGDQK